MRRIPEISAAQIGSRREIADLLPCLRARNGNTRDERGEDRTSAENPKLKPVLDHNERIKDDSMKLCMFKTRENPFVTKILHEFVW